jgi:hypothetical protein
MRLKLTVLVLAAAGCGGGGKREHAESTPTPNATIVAADADKDGKFWETLSDGQQTELAGLCKNLAADAAGEQFGYAVGNHVAKASDASVAREISVHYQRDGQGPIGAVCADVARGNVRRVVLTFDGNVGSRSKTANVTKTGSVFPPEADVTVRNDGGHAGSGSWGERQQVKVNPNSGKWTVRLALHSGENDFRLDGKHPGMRGAVEVFYVVKPKTAAEKAAERAAREEARQEQIVASTLSYSGNGSKTIGRIKIPQDSTLRWTNDGDLFQIFDDSFGLFVNSQAHSGDTDAPAGSYPGVMVNALGNWTITITPK